MENNKRRADRIAVPMKIKYRLKQYPYLAGEVEAKDISGGGLQMKIPTHLKKRDQVELALKFQERTIKATGEVAWHKKIDDAQEIVGVKYLKIAPNDKEDFAILFCDTMVDYFYARRQQ